MVRGAGPALTDSVCFTYRYTCEWGGVAAGRPYTGGLEEFGQLVLQDVWSMIQKLYLQVSRSADGRGASLVILGGKQVGGWGGLGFRPGGPEEHEDIVPCDPQPAAAQLEQPAAMLDDDSIQASFQQLKNPPSPARPRLLQDTVQQLMLTRGSLSLVTGQAGQGKTAFLV